MDKQKVERIFSCIPLALKNITGYFKNNFDESGQEIINNANGTIAVVIKLLAKEKIDLYFEKLDDNKLNNFGINTYIKASLNQLSQSLQELQGDLTNDSITKETNLYSIFEFDNSDVKTENLINLFSPKYHPAIDATKIKTKVLLSHLGEETRVINKVIHHFNNNIEKTVELEFGDVYEKHIEEINVLRVHENEAKILYDTFKLKDIGFQDNEDLLYEETFAYWQPITELNNSTKISDVGYKETIKKEQRLKPITELINQNYDCETNDINKITFIVADFGKGKSVFLKYHAAELAKKYSETKDGYFPIYFNLRNFSNYQSEGKLGVIDDFLQTDYGIKIEDKYFKSKKYLFLIDSLDESGELTKTAIDKVISSIKSIQNLDKSICRKNKIIISSRPFPDGLEEQLKKHEPFTRKVKKLNKDLPHYINLYGFTAKQFNHWLKHSLSKTSPLISDDMHKKLFDEGTLSIEELKRPIFSYMIYQLMINDINFEDIGKIGIYLSFINLLTKDAKHIEDSDIEVNFLDEIRYRNILHSIAALWGFQRQDGKQGILKKADICRVIEGKYSTESDTDILDRYKSKNVTEIKFLSHSYFGEKDNLLHFHHQSFAEILLAEYYLKVFIKYSLDKNTDLDIARSKLSIGYPTEQSIYFLKDLIVLLKETVNNDNNSEKVKEKRKLLLPLLASLAQEENNPLYSNDLFYSWFANSVDGDINKYLLDNWPINNEKLNKIIDFSIKVIENKNQILLAKFTAVTALFNNELSVFNNSKTRNIPADHDKWIALLVGNLLFTDQEKELFFNGKIKNQTHLFEMMRNHNSTYNIAAPNWAKEHLIGTLFNNSDFDRFNCSYINYSGIDFSYSEFEGLSMRYSNFYKCNFSYCKFKNVDISSSNLSGAIFNNLRDCRRLLVLMCQLEQFVVIPHKLTNLLRYDGNTSQGKFVNFGHDQTYLSKEIRFVELNIKGTLYGLLKILLDKKLTTKKEIKSWFLFDESSDDIRTNFYKFVDKISPDYK
ncbi:MULTISPECIES: pentapeptide repeat-containing protein [unclassified Pseudoalteromonas]|uniref:pentapeptide repeat-containing protein n=1 Tax=unclassified Pseudoalteromonas TaxID=194690 RepID=UPI003863E307